MKERTEEEKETKNGEKRKKEKYKVKIKKKMENKFTVKGNVIKGSHFRLISRNIMSRKILHSLPFREGKEMKQNRIKVFKKEKKK